MNIRLAEKNLIAGARTFYVKSENPKTPDVEYIVIEIRRNGKIRHFCNCGDFFGRKLVFFDTNQFSLCKHAQEVKDATEKA